MLLASSDSFELSLLSSLIFGLKIEAKLTFMILFNGFSPGSVFTADVLGLEAFGGLASVSASLQLEAIFLVGLSSAELD